MTGFVPSKFQTELPLDKIILTSKPGDEAVPFDVCFIGAGPASLAGAIELSKLVQKSKGLGAPPDRREGGPALGDLTIAVIEKGAEVGHHTLSGAVINPRALRELFPELKMEDFPLAGPVKAEKVLVLTEKSSFKIPTPPVMNNHGNYICSICELVRWLAERAAELGVEVLSGFPV